VCLNICVEAAASDRDSLTVAAESAARFGLQVAVRHASPWPWARTRPVFATVTEDGGCACSMLGDEAHWNAETWAVRPELIEPLAQTLEAMSGLGPSPYHRRRAVGRRHTERGT
jgi:hypothetical protein